LTLVSEDIKTDGVKSRVCCDLNPLIHTESRVSWTIMGSYWSCYSNI